MAAPNKISAYLSVFDDWDILPEALAAIDPLVDEIVVADGAYDWIVPFLPERDCRRSIDEVYDALAPYGRKVRVIQQIWTDEFQKRQAAYAACSNRYVFRMDADEINYFNHGAIDRFFESGMDVGMITIPLFATPEHIIYNKIRGAGLGALFDTAKIDARRHLDFLWLVLPNHLRQTSGGERRIFGEMIAFTPHLTMWRRSHAASNRALFYNLLALKNQGDDRIDAIPAGFRERLLGHMIVAGGPFRLEEGDEVMPPLVDLGDNTILKTLFQRYLDGIQSLNDGLKQPRAFSSGTHYNIDLSAPSAMSDLSGDLEYSDQVMKFEASVVTLHADVPFIRTQALRSTVEGNRVHVELAGPNDWIRRTLIVYAYIDGGKVGTMSLR